MSTQIEESVDEERAESTQNPASWAGAGLRENHPPRAERTAYAGLSTTHPWLAAALVVSFLSFAGIPPSAGLLAKLALVGAAIDAGYGWLALVAAVNSVISLAYYARVVAPMYFELAAEPAPLLGALAAVGIAVSAGGVLLVGIAAEAVFGALTGARLLPR